LFGSDEVTTPKPNRRKRKPLRIDDLANKLQPDGKRFESLFGNDATLENSLFESLLSEEPSEAAVVPNGSKAVRKSTCQVGIVLYQMIEVCHVDVCTTARQRHVYQIHLRVANLFQCSACDYTNNNSVWEMRKHCTAVHQGDAQPISNEELHKQDIQMWNQKCFPDWRLKRTAFWWRNDDESAPDQCSSSSCEDGTQNSLIEEDTNQNGIYEDGISFELDDETANSQPPDGLVVDDRTCHICWSFLRLFKSSFALFAALNS
uniref:C2H2-type domain-containing protein n=1 Tax=Ascaris lumbricoides TaxID=6252 RepID=A0A0M3IUU7_ASCLU